MLKTDPMVVLFGLLVMLLLGAGTYGAYRYLHDPYRTLEEFPVESYFTDYRTLAGSRFKSELKVEAELLWQKDTGRLMIFAQPANERPFVALVPSSLSALRLQKGQIYLSEIRIGEGGLIHVHTLEKQ